MFPFRKEGWYGISGSDWASTDYTGWNGSSTFWFLPTWPPWAPQWRHGREISHYPLGLLRHHHSREGQGMSLLPVGEDENPGFSTQLLFNTITPCFPPRQERKFGMLCCILGRVEVHSFPGLCWQRWWDYNYFSSIWPD